MTRERLPPRPTFALLLGAKVLLVSLMIVGAGFPEVGGFDGKGMGYRLPVYVIPALVVPLLWWRGRRWDPGLDIDLAAGSVGGAIGAWLAVSVTARWWQGSVQNGRPK